MGKLYFSISTLESIARNVLTQYKGSYLNQEPQAVPLERIIEGVFGLSIDYMRLTITGDELGRMIYDDGYTTRFNPEKDDYELVKVTAGTILIEALLLKEPKQYGRYRFTLAHELAHWVLHKALYAGTGIAAATYKADNCHDDSVEWQANYLAKAVLMPIGQVKRGYYGLKMQSEADGRIITRLADVFEVSKQAMEIRVKELGLV